VHCPYEPPVVLKASPVAGSNGSTAVVLAVSI
jgi:hypothetical protein